MHGIYSAMHMHICPCRRPVLLAPHSRFLTPGFEPTRTKHFAREQFANANDNAHEIEELSARASDQTNKTRPSAPQRDSYEINAWRGT